MIFNEPWDYIDIQGDLGEKRLRLIKGLKETDTVQQVNQIFIAIPSL